MLNRSPSCGSVPRNLVLLLVAFAAIVTVAYSIAYLRQPPDVAPPLPQQAAEAKAPSGSLPKIPFRNIVTEAGIDFVHRSGARGEKMLPEAGGSGCAFVDYDNDGDPDLVLISGRAWPWDEDEPRRESNSLALYRNDGGKFANVTNEAGLVADFYGQGVAVGDYDGDGDDDLYFTAVGGNRLFRNDAGRFTDVTANAGVAGRADDWTTSTGFFDYDRDGDLDLFVCNYLRWSREVDNVATKRVPGEGLTYAHPSNFEGVQNYLYRNDGGRFTDVSAEAGIHVVDESTGKPVGKALAVTFADFDQDGWIDVFVANDTVRHFLFRNQGDGTFKEVGQERGFALNAAGLTTSGMGIDAAWIRNDDQLAIAMSNFADEMTSLYVLQGKDDPFFTDEKISAGIGGPTRNVLTFGLLFEDLDLDGWVDLAETNGHLEETISIAQPSQQYRQPAKLLWNAGPDKQPQFVDLSAKNIADLATPIVGRGLASADIDGDGDLDLVISQASGPPLLLRNDQQSGNHWLRCRLEWPPGNRHAIGAIVELVADGVTQRRRIQPTRSYLSQTEPIATFGLGSATAVEGLTVTWPNGAKQQVDVDGVDRVFTIQQTVEDSPDTAAGLPLTFAELGNRAKAHLENSDFAQAINLLKRALELRPDSAAMRRNLARAYTLSGQPELALEELTKLRAGSPKPSAAIEYLAGLASARQLRNEDAVAHFRKAIELDPNEPTLQYQYGLALTALGRAAEAQQHFERAADLDPLHGGAQYQLATIARKAGDQEAFTRYMRDFQRIRAIKGPADPLSLEVNRYTNAEPPETAAPRTTPIAGTTAKFTIAEGGAEDGRPTAVVGAAVWAMDDAGKYQLVAVTAGGRLLLLDYTPDAGFHVTAESDEMIGNVGNKATVLVGNALVDKSTETTRRPGAQESQQDDQPEVAVVTPQRSWLIRLFPDGHFEDLTAKSNLSTAKGDAARWVDLDHDGDIDLCVASTAGLRVWRNNSDGQFVDATGDFGLSEVGPINDFDAADFDATNLGVDLVFAGQDGSSLYRNQYAGRFGRDQQAGESWPAAERVLVDDFNNDGLPDIFFVAPGEATFVVTGKENNQPLALALDQLDAVTTIDVDNDGWLDVAIAGSDGSGFKAFILRNVGGRFADIPEAIPAPARVRRSGLLDADLNNDGRTDLMLVGADGQLWLLRNETNTANRQLKLALRSYGSNPSSIGTRVQVRSGEQIVTRWTSRELPIEIGLGKSTIVDSVQTLWVNGISLNLIGVELTGKPVWFTILEFVRTSSCPFLYAWIDGEWQFVTDLLGTAPLNVSIARGVPMPPDPDEVVVLGPAERYVDGGTVRLRVTSELREAIYLDQVRLLAVDHPADTVVFSRDRVAPTGVSGMQIVAGGRPVAPRSAIGSDGVDRTAAVAEEDGVFASPGRVLPPPVVGFTEPLSLELDFGQLNEEAKRGDEGPAGGLLLALTGWFRFGNSSTNIAASQRSDLQVIWPRLEAAGSDGRWHVVEEMVGFPAGNTKTIVCDLSGKLPNDTKRLRLTTSFEVRWDHIALYERVPSDALQVVELPPASADLQWHGFAELRPRGDDQPQVPNLAKLSDTPRWSTAVEGWCTRYGDVRPLVVDADPLMAILNSGDGATIAFAANTLLASEPAACTLLLYTRGWIKEFDPNSMPDRRVEPLPDTGSVEHDASHDWQLQYNTRWVPGHRGPAIRADDSRSMAHPRIVQ